MGFDGEDLFEGWLGGGGGLRGRGEMSSDIGLVYGSWLSITGGI